MTTEEIKELVQLVIDSGVAELEVTRGEDKVRIQRSFSAAAQEILVPAQTAAAPAPATQSPAGQSATNTPQPEAKAADDKTEHIQSPIVGTFYEAPSPDADPFVRVGDHVTPGQVLCIIESMKLMNEIEAELAGTIVDKLVENGRPVEYGQALFTIRPD